MRSALHTFLTIFWLATLGGVRAETIELLTNMDYPPYIDATLPGGGLHTEIIREAYRAVGLELKVRVMPWKRISRELADGRALGSFSWAATKDRRSKFIVSRPVFYSDAVIFTRLADFKTLADIDRRAQEGKSTIMCRPLGWTVPSFVADMEARGVLRTTQPARLRSCFELMLAGRADFVDVPTLAAWHELQAMISESGEPEAVRAAIHVEYGSDADGGASHILFVKSEAGERASVRYSEGLDIIARNGTLVEIVDRHIAAYPGVDREALLRGLRLVGVLPPLDGAP